MDICSIVVGVEIDRQDNRIDRESLHDSILPDIRYMLAKAFGGYTENVLSGGWITPDGQLMEEEVRQFTVFIDVGDGRDWKSIFCFCADRVGEKLNHHSIVRIINGVASHSEAPRPD